MGSNNFAILIAVILAPLLLLMAIFFFALTLPILWIGASLLVFFVIVLALIKFAYLIYAMFEGQNTKSQKDYSIESLKEVKGP